MTQTINPVVVDLGKKRSKTVRALKNGEGPLMDEVSRVLDEVRARSPELASKELVPVVIVYRKKPARKSKSRFPFDMMKWR